MSVAATYIQLICPSCSRLLSIPSSYAGQSGTCNSCGGRLVVPEPEEYLAGEDVEEPVEEYEEQEEDEESGALISFTHRFLAYSADFLLLLIVGCIPAAIAAYQARIVLEPLIEEQILRAYEDALKTGSTIGAFLGALFLLGGVYGIVAESIFGGTIGKMMLGIVVADDDGEKAGVGSVMVRNIFKVVSLTSLPLTVLLMFINRQNRTLHDFLSGTYLRPALPHEEKKQLGWTLFSAVLLLLGRFIKEFFLPEQTKKTTGTSGQPGTGDATERRTIATAVQRGRAVHMYDEKGLPVWQMDAGDGLVGYTQNTVSIRKGIHVATYDTNGRLVSNVRTQ